MTKTASARLCLMLCRTEQKKGRAKRNAIETDGADAMIHATSSIISLSLSLSRLSAMCTVLRLETVGQHIVSQTYSHSPDRSGEK